MASGTYVKITVVLSDGTTTEQEFNVRNGDDAFEVWAKDNPGGTKEDYYEAIKGDAGPANVLTVGTVTTGAPTDPAAAEITGDSPNQVLNLTIPQGTPGKDSIKTVDGITVVGSSTNVVMAPATISSIKSGEITVTPPLSNVRDVTMYVHHDSGLCTIDLSKWDNAVHPRLNVRIICGTNGGGTFKIVPPSTYMWNTNGLYAVPETITITRNIAVYDVINTYGSAPAITRIYPGPGA